MEILTDSKIVLEITLFLVNRHIRIIFPHFRITHLIFHHIEFLKRNLLCFVTHPSLFGYNLRISVRDVFKNLNSLFLRIGIKIHFRIFLSERFGEHTIHSIDDSLPTRCHFLGSSEELLELELRFLEIKRET